MTPEQIAKLIKEEYEGLEDEDQFQDPNGVIYYIVEVLPHYVDQWEESEHYNEYTAGYYDFGQQDPAECIRRLEEQNARLTERLNKLEEQLKSQQIKEDLDEYEDLEDEDQFEDCEALVVILHKHAVNSFIDSISNDDRVISFEDPQDFFGNPQGWQHI